MTSSFNTSRFDLSGLAGRIEFDIQRNENGLPRRITHAVTNEPIPRLTLTGVDFGDSVKASGTVVVTGVQELKLLRDQLNVLLAPIEDKEVKKAYADVRKGALKSYFDNASADQIYQDIQSLIVGTEDRWAEKARIFLQIVVENVVWERDSLCTPLTPGALLKMSELQNLEAFVEARHLESLSDTSTEDWEINTKNYLNSLPGYSSSSPQGPLEAKKQHSYILSIISHVLMAVDRYYKRELAAT